MKLLFLLQEFPYPADNGVSWKSYTLLQGLSSKHKCDLIAFSGRATRAHIDALTQQLPGVSVLGVFRPSHRFLSAVRGLLRRGLPSSGAFADNSFRRAVVAALRRNNYDLVHVDMINLVQHCELIKGVPVLISLNDAVSLAYSNRALGLSGLTKFRMLCAQRLIARYERRALQHRIVHVVAKEDKEYLDKVLSSTRVETIKLPVDPVYFESRASEDQCGKVKVAIPANCSHPGISDRILQILETVACRKALQDRVIFQLFGNPGSRSFQAQLHRFRNVEVLGWVDDFRAQLSEADIVIFPETSGAGTKNRVLQAMALAKPVVLSPVAAIGANGKSSKNCIVSTEPTEFASALELLLESPSLRQSLGSEAQQSIKAEHCLSEITVKWESLYQSLIVT
jgi:polysaccharide biosynthesis protein PslH